MVQLGLTTLRRTIHGQFEVLLLFFAYLPRANVLTKRDHERVKLANGFYDGLDRNARVEVDHEQALDALQNKCQLAIELEHCCVVRFETNEPVEY